MAYLQIIIQIISLIWQTKTKGKRLDISSVTTRLPAELSVACHPGHPHLSNTLLWRGHWFLLLATILTIARLADRSWETILLAFFYLWWLVTTWVVLASLQWNSSSTLMVVIFFGVWPRFQAASLSFPWTLFFNGWFQSGCIRENSVKIPIEFFFPIKVSIWIKIKTLILKSFSNINELFSWFLCLNKYDGD